MATRFLTALKQSGRLKHRTRTRGWGSGAAAGVFIGTAMLSQPSRADDVLPAVVVRAAKRSYHNCLVSVTVSLTPNQKATLGAKEWALREVDISPVVQQPETPARIKNMLALPNKHVKSAYPVQISEQNGQTRLTFWVYDLVQGDAHLYHLERAAYSPSRPFGVVISRAGDDLEVRTEPSMTLGEPGPGGQLFTRYTTRSGPNKPFFYPILTPDGQNMTRTWPLDPASTESHDHPHHRGLWFMHSDLNGIDFWTEQNTDKIHVGRTVAKGFTNQVSGRIFGGFRAYTEWRAPDDKLIATDVRDVRVYQLGTDRIMDFEITITPNGEPLKWGDNKDGTFGLRLPDTLAPNPEKSAYLATPTGHIETSTGLKDGAAWGQPAEWVDYYGPIGGKTWGVAMFDNPQNLRHPTTWHARDYALFAANPFGLHDFKRGDRGAGDYIQPADKTLTFRYRLLFHAGDTAAAHVGEQYINYADPPEVTVQ